MNPVVSPIVPTVLPFFQRLFASVRPARLRLRTAIVFLACLTLLWGPAAYADAYQVGLKFYVNGQYSLASQYFLEVVTKNPENPNAHYYLADSYLKLNRLGEAQAEYQKILAVAPGSQAARLSQVGLSQLRGYLQTSRQERWRKAGDTGVAGAMDQYNGPPPNGEDYLDDITESGKYVRWSLSKMPLKLYIESSPQGIRNFQPAFISQVQRATEVWVSALNHQLGYVRVNSPDQADVRVTWTNSIDSRGHSGDGGTSYTAGLMIPHIKNDQIEFMEVKLATFDIKGNPQSSDTIYAVAIHELGHSLGLLGHSQDANDIMFAENQRITTLSRRDSNTIRRLYTLEADINNTPMVSHARDAKREKALEAKADESIAKLEKQAKEDGMALTWLNLGVSYYQKGKDLATKGKPDPAFYDKAVKAISKAIELEPQDSRAYHKRSLVYQEQNNYAAALGDIQKAIVLDRQEPEFYMLQAWYLAKVGQAGAARSSLDTYLLYKPGEANSEDVQQIRAALGKDVKSAL